MNTKHVLAEHLRNAEAEGRSISTAEANLIETLASREPEHVPTPQVVPVYATSRVEPLVCGFSMTQLGQMVEAIREGRSLSVQAAASLYDTTRPFGNPQAQVSPNTSLVNFFRGTGAGVISGMARNIGHVQTTEALVAEDWVAGDPKKQIPVAWTDAVTHTPAAYSLVYEPNTVDIAGLGQSIQGLLNRAVVARENHAIAGDLLTAAQAGTNDADPLIAAANAMAKVTENGGTPSMFIVSSDAFAQLISSATFGFASEVGTSTLFGMPLIGIGGLAANTIMAADPRSVGLAYSGLTAYVGQSNPVYNEMIVRVESNLATVIFDPYSIAKVTIGAAA